MIIYKNKYVTIANHKMTSKDEIQLIRTNEILILHFIWILSWPSQRLQYSTVSSSRIQTSEARNLWVEV